MSALNTRFIFSRASTEDTCVENDNSDSATSGDADDWTAESWQYNAPEGNTEQTNFFKM